jgi:hypothetical protein
MSRLFDAIALFDVGAFIEQYEDCVSGGPDELRVHECPKCLNQNHKLYVNTSKHVWICYVCEWGRNQHDIVVLLAAISGRTLNDIRKEILQDVPPAVSGDLEDLLRRPGPQLELPLEEPEKIELPGSLSFTSYTGASVLAYAQQRGLTQSDVTQCRLRVAGRLKSHRGPWLVFPVFHEGRAVAYQGRNIHNRPPKYASAGSISQYLWPEDNLCNQSSQLILVEGPFDALGLRRLGYTAVCSFGKKLSERQEQQLREWSPKELVFMWDADARSEVQNAVSRIAYAFPRTLVANLSNPTSFRKIDPGDALQDSQIASWIQSKVENAMDITSTEYLEWQLCRE